jgi:hypothetical protein
MSEQDQERENTEREETEGDLEVPEEQAGDVGGGAGIKINPDVAK